MSGFPEKGADLRGSPGIFRGSLGNFRGTPGLLVSSTVGEPLGKSPKNFRSLGELPGKSGDFPEAGGESDSLPATRQICLQVLELSLQASRLAATSSALKSGLTVEEFLSVCVCV